MDAPEHSVFLAGIGGMGMAPLAIYLAERGWRVAGADDALTPRVAHWLERAGVALCGEIPADCGTLVATAALPQNHRWRQQAARLGCPQQSRGEFLAGLAQSRKLLAVAGSHGKTSTTAMLIDLCRQAGIACDYVLGGLFRDETMAPARAFPDAEWLIAEVDESDGTIEAFAPEATVLVNADWDHADHYRDAGALEAAFGRLLQRTRGTVVMPRFELSRFPLVPTDRIRGVEVPGSPGAFRKANEALARAAFELLQPGPQPATVNGYVFRRQEVLCESGGLRVLTDYAHHPAEIQGLLATGQPDLVVFQPHRHSRTRQFAATLRAALRGSHEVLLLPVYPAGEAAVEGGTSEAIAEGTSWPVTGLDDASATVAPRLLAASSEAPIEVWMVGAGDIDAWARRLVEDVQALRRLRGLLEPETVLRLAEPLAPKTTLRIGGSARFYAEPASVEDLRQLWQWAQANAVEVLWLGRGSNLIVADEGFDGLAVAFRHSSWRSILSLGGERFRVGPGVRLKELCGAAAAAGCSGFEFLEGIPGAVGGSLRMNAGAMGGWIFDRVETVRFLNATGEICERPGEWFRAGYRSCPGLEGAVVLSVVFRGAASAAPEAIRQRMAEMAAQRKAAQPREPSAGCLFKNPKGGHAGALIDQAGLKGTRWGGVGVSPVHANFLVNHGEGRAADVFSLAREVRQRVTDGFGVTLEPEPLLVGRTWAEIWQDG